MADSEWKKRLGITINYSSGEDEDDIRLESLHNSFIKNKPQFSCFFIYVHT